MSRIIAAHNLCPSSEHGREDPEPEDQYPLSLALSFHSGGDSGAGPDNPQSVRKASIVETWDVWGDQMVSGGGDATCISEFCRGMTLNKNAREAD